MSRPAAATTTSTSGANGPGAARPTGERRTAGPRLTAALLIIGAVLVNAAFLGLGVVFDYPDVLSQPPAEVLVTFGERQPTIAALFLLLAAGAGVLGPISLRLGRLGGSGALRWSVPVGVAASVVQVLGLLRWPLVVPVLAATPADPSAIATFHTLNVVLGTILGETVGYALTALWTILVAVGLRASLLGRVLSIVGLVCGVMIAVGVVEPLGVRGVGPANFVGYVLWSAWLVAIAVLLLRRGRQAPSGSE